MAAWTQLLPLVGAVPPAAGLALVFVAWRRRHLRKARHRLALTAGWMMVAAGLAALTAANGDVGLADAVTLSMLLALSGIAAHSLTLVPPRRLGVRTRSGPSLSAGKPGLVRPAARLAGSVAAAPVFGLLGALVAVKWSPGDPATRLMIIAIIAILAAAGALVFVLASRRPIRATGVLACASVAFTLLLALPGSPRP